MVNKISSFRIKFDKFIDYIPLASTINGAIDLIQKKIFAHKDNPSAYQEYIQKKSPKKCIVYMLPFARPIDKLREKILEHRNDKANEMIKKFNDVMTEPYLNNFKNNMSNNAKAYFDLAGSKDTEWKENKDFLLAACQIFVMTHLPHQNKPGHEHDQEYFEAFVEAAHPEDQDWMREMIEKHDDAEDSVYHSLD